MCHNIAKKSNIKAKKLNLLNIMIIWYNIIYRLYIRFRSWIFWYSINICLTTNIHTKIVFNAIHIKYVQSLNTPYLILKLICQFSCLTFWNIRICYFHGFTHFVSNYHTMLYWNGWCMPYLMIGGFSNWYSNAWY